MQMPMHVGKGKQGESSTEAEADTSVEPEVPNEVAVENPVAEQDNEVGDDADVVETSEGEDVQEAEGEETQGADVTETPRRKSRKRRRNSNRGRPFSNPDSSRKERQETEIAGCIFMCNAVTKKDCFKYGVFGFPEQKKDIVEQVKKGMKLFLFDVDKKVLYGIYEAKSRSGMNLVPEAFRESDRKFPAQVRFRIYKDCVPLAESDVKQAIKDNYNRGGRFKNELSAEQVRHLMRLFRPLDLEGMPQSILSRDRRREPTSRDARRGLSRNAHARGSARHHVSQPAPPVPVREPVYSRELTSLYARERPAIDVDYYRTQPSYASVVSEIAFVEAEARRRYLDHLYLEQSSLIAKRPLLHDPLYRGAEYQGEVLHSNYGGYRNLGLPY